MSGVTPKKIIIKKNSLKRFIIPNDSNASPFIFFNKNMFADQNSDIIENQSINMPVLLTQQADKDDTKVICLKNEESNDMENIIEEAGTSSEALPLKNAPKTELSGQKFILIKKAPIENTVLIKPEEESRDAADIKLVYKTENESHTKKYAERPKITNTTKFNSPVSYKIIRKNEVENNVTVSHTTKLAYRKLPSIIIEPELIISNPRKVIKIVKSEPSRTELPEPSSMFKISELPKDEPMREASPANDDDTIFCTNDPLLIRGAKVEPETIIPDAEESTTISESDYAELIYVEPGNDSDEQVKDEARSNETQLVEVEVECDASSQQEDTIESDTSNVNSTKGDVEQPKRRKSNKYRCSHCENSFQRERPYRMHLSEHVKDALWEDKPNSCWECNMLFASQEAWNKHILSSVKHKAQVKLITNGCRFCGKTFETTAELETHKAEGHSRKKRARDQKWPTPCEMCGEMQANYVRYWAHTRRAHPGERYPLRAAYDHVCGECGKEFRCLSLLKQHENIHRGVRPYICGQCGKSFFTPLALQMHDTTHSEHRPFICETCGAAFKFKHNVERHQLVHTGERPFVCGECGRGFTTLHWTQMHVRKVHYNEYIPYKPRIRKHRQRKTE